MSLLLMMLHCNPEHCRFFNRYNKVVLDVAAVDREKGRLEQENEDLRQLLKTFLDGIRYGWTPGMIVFRCLGPQAARLGVGWAGDVTHASRSTCIT